MSGWLAAMRNPAPACMLRLPFVVGNQLCAAVRRVVVGDASSGVRVLDRGNPVSRICTTRGVGGGSRNRSAGGALSRNQPVSVSRSNNQAHRHGLVFGGFKKGQVREERGGTGGLICQDPILWAPGSRQGPVGIAAKPASAATPGDAVRGCDWLGGGGSGLLKWVRWGHPLRRSALEAGQGGKGNLSESVHVAICRALSSLAFG